MNWIKELIEILLKPLCNFISWSANKFRYLVPTHPLKTIVIANVNQEYSCLWNMGKIRNKNAMQINGDFLITNITEKENIQLSGALIDKKRKIRGTVLIRGVSANYIIPPHATVEVRIIIWVEPPVRVEGESYVEDIAIVDNFGNQHWFDKCNFKYM